MTRVHRVGKRFKTWWLLPPALALATVAVAIWPHQEGSRYLLVAKQDLAAGTQVSAGDFERVSIGSDIEISNYVSELDRVGMLNRTVFKGELLPAAAVTLGALDRRTPVVIAVSGTLSKSLRVGSTVDVWATSPSGMPAAIVLDATVLNLEQSASLGKTQTTVELAVATEYLEPLIQAKASSSAIELLLQPTLADQ